MLEQRDQELACRPKTITERRDLEVVVLSAVLDDRVLHFFVGGAREEGLPADVRQEYESAEAENQKWRHIAKNFIDKKADANRLTELLAESDLNIEQEKLPLAPGRLVPVINKVSAGYPTDFNDRDYPVGIADDYIRGPDLHDPNTFAVRVVGDSMEPKFHEGDIVIFSPATEVHNGDDCFVRFAMPHETTFKRVFFESDNQIRLQPRNEKYSPTIVDGKRINGLYRAVVKHEIL